MSLFKHLCISFMISIVSLFHIAQFYAQAQNIDKLHHARETEPSVSTSIEIGSTFKNAKPLVKRMDSADSPSYDQFLTQEFAKHGPHRVAGELWGADEFDKILPERISPLAREYKRKAYEKLRVMQSNYDELWKNPKGIPFADVFRLVYMEKRQRAFARSEARTALKLHNEDFLEHEHKGWWEGPATDLGRAVGLDQRWRTVSKKRAREVKTRWEIVRYLQNRRPPEPHDYPVWQTALRERQTSRDSQEAGHSRDQRNLRDPQSSQESPSSQNPQGARNSRDSQKSRDSQSSRDPPDLATTSNGPTQPQGREISEQPKGESKSFSHVRNVMNVPTKLNTYR